jgi:hypothetical protein
MELLEPKPGPEREREPYLLEPLIKRELKFDKATIKVPTYMTTYFHNPYKNHEL